MMNRVTVVVGALCLCAAGGCATKGGDPLAMQQEDLGKGIVWGSLASQEQGEKGLRDETSRVSVGQVVGLEGAAYLVRESSGQEFRVPHDENTRSDRPAHIGDRIQASLDRQGRAIRIHNLDRSTP